MQNQHFLLAIRAYHDYHPRDRFQRQASSIIATPVRLVCRERAKGEEFMIGKRTSRVLSVLGLLALTALPARAQITTGTVSGTVKDVQGGVVPGATVVLISETKGTKSQP